MEQVIVVGPDTTTLEASWPPTVTEAGDEKFTPLIVRVAPPLIGPIGGETAVITG